MHLLNYGADLCLNSCLFTSFYKMTWVWKMTDLLNYQSEGSAFPFGSRQVHIWSNFHEICISEILIFYLVFCTFKLDVLKANLTHINCKTKKKMETKVNLLKIPQKMYLIPKQSKQFMHIQIFLPSSKRHRRWSLHMTSTVCSNEPTVFCYLSWTGYAETSMSKGYYVPSSP